MNKPEYKVLVDLKSIQNDTKKAGRLRNDASFTNPFVSE